MGKMHLSKGSELHLLRFLGRHRHELDEAIFHKLMEDTGQQTKSIDWLDVPFDPRNPQKDGEWKSVDFLDDYGGLLWEDYWPDPAPGDYNRIGVPSWDSVAIVELGNRSEYLLVEAKAHTNELANRAARCGAEGDHRITIKNRLRETYTTLGGIKGEWLRSSDQWLGNHYQKANRLACLHFLNHIAKQPARLLYVYFTGDCWTDAPCDKTDWDTAINAQYQALGIGRRSCNRLHEVFLNVICEKQPLRR